MTLGTRGVCKVCSGEARPFDSVDRLKCCVGGRYPFGPSGDGVIYLRCEDCGFIFTRDFDDWSGDDWRSQIYNDDYLIVDPCYAGARPRASLGLILSQFRKDETVGLDYGAGQGLMAAALREKGWNYDACEPYGESTMLSNNAGRYNVCSSIEVFEHTVDPLAEMARIVGLCSGGRLAVVIGTNVSDGEVDENRRLGGWWYAAPRNGHISLFSKEALRRMAARFSLDFASFGSSTHYLTRGWQPAEVARMAYIGKARRLMRLV